MCVVNSRASFLVVLSLSLPAAAQSWHLGPATLIHEYGAQPSLWNGTVAYLEGNGGAVMFYNGTATTHIYGPDTNSWEPAIANGTIAWRNTTSDAASSEILLWDGQAVVNLSNSPGIIDCDLASGGNGDLIWTQDHTWLMYYDASIGCVQPLGIRGVHPSLYITASGTATYAFQDPDTDEVKYFDGEVVHSLGPGASYGAKPSLWDGRIVWVGEGEGTLFTTAELFHWENGDTQRITDDDAVGGVIDLNPSIYNGVVIWSRHTYGPFLPPRLFLWDGQGMTQLSSTGGKFPSFHGGDVVWEDYDGMYTAAVVSPIDGDCNGNGMHDAEDFHVVASCLTGPGGPNGNPMCDCGQLDADGDVDLVDIAVLQTLF